MANTLSAEKRIDVNKRNQLRNKAYKSTIRTIYKKCLVAISNKDENNIDVINSLLSLSYSKLDKAVQKGMMHKNAAASKKAALAKALKTREQNK
ncbi:MAG TPA: 30S ribosomal protein S20 [Bacteroidetes bacterium]|jgi:small subunit ribosomal protein S20|nr:30S ribosomal protein S20 [Bacteroidota bacterium]|tara:strand:+ start:6093 stop:6374 length:282 start_codon:yes stop_codon:yes gene_type:complete